jgi:hypothetical protein
MKRPRLFFALIFCTVLVLVYSFEARALAQEGDSHTLIGVSLDPGLKLLSMPITTTPPPRPTPAPPSSRVSAKPTLGKPAFSARIFYWGAGACGPRHVTISVNASDPRGIARVQIHIRLASQSGNETTGFVPLKMDPANTAWVHTINSRDIPGYNSSTLPWWLQFYFTATDNHGAQTRSSTYGNNIMLSNCVQLP